MRELRFAVRRLVAAPGFSLTAIVTLALGIGATTLMFSAVHGLLVRPLPFPAADDLGWVMAQPANGQHEGLSSDEATAVAARVPAIERIAVIGDVGLVRELGARHERWRGIWATRGLADVLGVSVAVGSIPPRIDPAGPRQILIAHERWQRDFKSDASLIGRELVFADHKRFIVAGVLPAGLEFPFARAPHRGNGAGFVVGRQDFWVLQPDEAGALPGGFAIARLRAPAAGLRTQLATVSNTLANHTSQSLGRALTFTPLRTQVLGTLAPALPVLQVFAGLVFLIACANLATLLLARAVAQRDEVAIRVALGARAAVLARTFAVDALVLCAGGAALGFGIAAAGRHVLVRLAPRHQALVDRIVLDSTTVLFVCAVAIMTTIVFGVLPGWFRARAAVAGAPRAAARTTAPGVQMAFRSLVVAQVAMSLALVVAAVALRDSFRRIMHVDAGYDMRGVVAADVLLYLPMKEAMPLIDGLVRRLQAAPRVDAVGLVHSTPLTAKWTIQDSMEVLAGPRAGQTPPMTGGFVAYDYFQAMGVPLLSGRTFTRTEFTSSRQRVMIINDVAAHAFFPDRSAVGARVRMNDQLHEIVGVVKGTRDARLDTPAEPQWYQPALLGSSQVIVRGTGGTTATKGVVERALRETDSRLIVERVEALESIAAESVVERRLAAEIVSAFAAVAVILAGIGLYGVVHFTATRRQREFGIRMAIGARPVDVLGLVVRQGVLMSAAGVAAGAIVSVGASGALQSLLFESQAADPVVVTSSAAVLTVVAAVASLRPGWRAASVDPVETLRAD